jgi:hypothetical protein
MATNYDRTVFVNGSEPAINAENLNKITAFCDAIASGGAGSVVCADLALNSNNLSGKGLDAATSTTPDKIPLRDANGIVRNPAVNPNNGLVFAASPTLPEYPDNAAGTNYIRNNNFTAADISGTGLQETGKWAYRDGGGGVWDNTKLAIVVNEMQMTHTVSSIANYARIAVDPRNRTVRLKVYAPVATIIRLDADGTVYEKSLLAGINLIDQSLDGIGNAHLDVSFYNAGVYRFALLYIGDGTYSSRLLDASGNGNHGTVFGVTPTADGGLSFDGVNDYVQTLYTQNIAGDEVVSGWINIPSAYSWDTAGAVYIIGGNVNQRGFGVVRWTTNNTLRLAIRTADVSLATANVAITRDTWTHVLGIYRGASTKVLSFYLNGVLVSESSPFTGVTGYTSPVAFGRLGYSGSPATLHYTGQIRDPRIYNRTLTEAEITALATNPDAYNLDRVTRSVTPVPGSVMTRNTVGGSELANLKLTGVASADPNTLDFYEEGTFTPELLFGGAKVGMTGSFNGNYTRVGNRVFFNMRVSLSAKGTSVGNATIAGLPFVVTIDVANNAPLSMYFSAITYTGQLVSIASSGTSTCVIGRCTEAGAFANITNTNFVDNSLLIISGNYYI